MKADSLFPFDELRNEQSEMLQDVFNAVKSGSNLLAHAPTGLGKTAAALAPSLAVALEQGYTVYFLTSRQTQHSIAIDTLQAIKEKHHKTFNVVDMVGKKNMCARTEVAGFYGKQFHDYCKSLRNDEKCDYFLNFKKKGQLSPPSQNVLNFLRSKPAHTQEVVDVATKEGVCPYEVSSHATKTAAVIIADYNQLFNPSIRESFFTRNEKALDKAIIVVDEAHNLPDRLRDMLTEKLNDFIINRALKEAEQFSEGTIVDFLTELKNGMHVLADKEEKLITKDQLLISVKDHDIEATIDTMDNLAAVVRESSNQSFLGSVADFLTQWLGEDEGFARILSTHETSQGTVVNAAYHCLDPSLHAKEVIDLAHSVIMMSGTLTPLSMYEELLGFKAVKKEYNNPFKKENKLSLIVRGVTTKYTARNDEQFRKIAAIVADTAMSVPGNIAIYFPSYRLMEQVHLHLYDLLEKEVFKERQGMSKEEKNTLLQKFKLQWLKGGVLLAVVGGNFSEGIDLPNESLNGVVVVGLPLGRPDLYTKTLIDFYQKRYKRGWDYGYTYPAFTKILQTAGRCIRTEQDRGVVMFVDERYAWDNYYACFPKDYAPKTTSFYKEEIAKFFQ